MAVQLFGRRSCADTRKAERWLKERKIQFQFVDLDSKGISPGELDAVARSLGGYGALVDRHSKAYADHGFAHMEFDEREELLERPAIVRSPIIRSGKLATAGFDPEALSTMMKA